VLVQVVGKENVEAHVTLLQQLEREQRSPAAGVLGSFVAYQSSCLRCLMSVSEVKSFKRRCAISQRLITRRTYLVI